MDNALSGHVYILIFALIMMSVIMAVVGVLGLMSAMGTSVIERTREFGVMRAIGGRSGTVMRNVISEGVFIGMMSLSGRWRFISLYRWSCLPPPYLSG